MIVRLREIEAEFRSNYQNQGHSTDQSGRAGESVPECVPYLLRLQQSNQNRPSRNQREEHTRQQNRDIERSLVGAQPPLGPNNADLRNETSRSRIPGSGARSGQISTVGVGLVQAPVEDPPRGVASLRRATNLPGGASLVDPNGPGANINSMWTSFGEIASSIQNLTASFRVQDFDMGSVISQYSSISEALERARSQNDREAEQMYLDMRTILNERLVLHRAYQADELQRLQFQRESRERRESNRGNEYDY